MEIRFSSAENVRVEVEIQSDDETGTPRAIVHEVTENTSTPTPADDPEGENEENMPALREEAKTRLQRLGKLYSGKEIVKLFHENRSINIYYLQRIKISWV